MAHTHTLTPQALMAIYPGEPDYAGCPLILPVTQILLKQAQTLHVLDTIPPSLS